MSMQKITTTDLVVDEYGNYYEVIGLQKNEDTLTGIEVSNLYFEKSFQQFFDTENLDENYNRKPLGLLLQDLVNDHIAEMEKNSRPIYAIRDLLVNRIDVYAVDIRKPHPKSSHAY